MNAEAIFTMEKCYYYDEDGNRCEGEVGPSFEDFPGNNRTPLRVWQVHRRVNARHAAGKATNFRPLRVHNRQNSHGVFTD